MANAQELHKYCEQLREEYDKELENVFSEYFEMRFINQHRPFRAIIGNKRCKPIPIYKDIDNRTGLFYWPNFSEELLRKKIENLGFVIVKGKIPSLANKIYIVVPKIEKGQELSFAQKWVLKINKLYSEYCAQEKRRAKELYEKFIMNLLKFPKKRIMMYEDFLIFTEFESSKKMSEKCFKFFKKMMDRDGISEYFIEDTYIGIKVLRQLPSE